MENEGEQPEQPLQQEEGEPVPDQQENEVLEEHLQQQQMEEGEPDEQELQQQELTEEQMAQL